MDDLGSVALLGRGATAREVMVPSQSTNARGLNVLLVNRSLIRWTTPSKVQEKHTSKAKCALSPVYNVHSARPSLD